MKTRLKRVFAACIACLVLLMSAVLPVAASFVPLDPGEGIFYGATATATHTVYNSVGSVVTSNITISFALSQGDQVVLDSWYYTTRNKVGFYELGRYCNTLHESGNYFESSVIKITLQDPVPLNYTWLYSSDPSLYPIDLNRNVVSNFKFHVRTSSGSATVLDAMYSDGALQTYGNGLGLDYYDGYVLTGLQFTLSPNILAYTDQMRNLAQYLGYTDVGSWENPFQLYADNGAIRYGQSQENINAARNEGYTSGYNAAMKQFESDLQNRIQSATDEAYQNGFSVGKTEGAVSGRQEGYNSGLSEGLITGRAEGEEIGYDKAITENKDAWISVGYNSGYQRALQLVNTDTNLSMRELLFSVVNAPVEVFVNTFNFDFLGFNLASFFTSLLTIAVVSAVFVFLIKKLT